MKLELLGGWGFAVCDGSFKDDTGTAAWIIEGADSNTQLVGSWYTPSHGDDHSSFRSKLAGIVGVLNTLSFWPPTQTAPFRLACDGLSVVTRILSHKPIEPMEPHADLLGAACTLLQSCRYNVDLIFVCGHQDTGTPMVLARDAWLNVEADALAKDKASTPHAGLECYK